MREKVLIILVIMLSLLCIISSIYNLKLYKEKSSVIEEKNKKSELNNEEYEGEIGEVDYKKATIKVVDTIGNIGIKVKKDFKVMHGESNWYRIDKYENGGWKKLTRRKEVEMVVFEIAIFPGETVTVINFKDDYGMLENGIYRYIEKACIENEDEKDYISCIFEIK